MKWQRGHRSKNVEDRRGSTGRRTGAIAGGSAVVVLLAALISQALGIDVSGLFGGGGGESSSEQSSEPVKATPEEEEAFDFMNTVLDDIQATYARQFEQRGWSYPEANLVIFREEVRSPCGVSSAAVGPFYCPGDSKAYIDLSFFMVLRDRLGARGDFAQAYVLAHELGHHVQNLRGVLGHRDSVRVELQADCYAGVWAHSTEKRGLLDRGDIEEAVNAAASIGDDRLQKMGGGEVNPETFTHGTSEQRARWFRTGMQNGRFEDCDTFRGKI